MSQPNSSVGGGGFQWAEFCVEEAIVADPLTVLAIHESDITSEVCQRCAKCCEIDLRIAGTDSRYRKFLRGVGLSVSPPIEDGKDDCCDLVHEITIHMGPCRHLQTQAVEDETLYSCGLYGDPRRPQLCDEYNCVSWAKVNNTYSTGNMLLATAQRAWARTIRDQEGGTQ